MKTHELKCWPMPFEALLAGKKTAEFRLDDRGFAVGDELLLREWSFITGEYSERCVRRVITHIQRGFGMPEGYAVLSFAPVTRREFTNELGNTIRITIEGPTSVHENIVTQMEFQHMRDAMVAHGAADICPNCDEPMPAGCGGTFKDEAACRLHEPACKRCGGSGVVDDGEIAFDGAYEFQNGPIRCVKDCPECCKTKPVVHGHTGAPKPQDLRRVVDAAMAVVNAHDAWVRGGFATPMMDAINALHSEAEALGISLDVLGERKT